MTIEKLPLIGAKIKRQRYFKKRIREINRLILQRHVQKFTYCTIEVKTNHLWSAYDLAKKIVKYYRKRKFDVLIIEDFIITISWRKTKYDC